MASTVVRRSEKVSEMNYAIFTPCPICDAKGPKTPSISIQAERVVQDEALHAILCRNAVFRVGGVPILTVEQGLVGRMFRRKTEAPWTRRVIVAVRQQIAAALTIIGDQAVADRLVEVPLIGIWFRRRKTG